MTRPGKDELEELLRRLTEANVSLIQALKDSDPDLFGTETSDGESLKQTLERTADDVHFYYGRLVARAMSLPQPPCLMKADFSSLREAAASVQIAHRRLTNLLHDLVPGDLDRKAVDPELGTYTLRQILEMATAHYALRAQQVARLGREIAEAGE
jgi:hypothetical protein